MVLAMGSARLTPNQSECCVDHEHLHDLLGNFRGEPLVFET